MIAVYSDTAPGALWFLALPAPSDEAPVIQEETMRGFFRLTMSACLFGGLAGVVPGEAASQSCVLADGDSIAEAIGRGCTRIALGAGTYSERLTVDGAVRITGASESASPLAAVITANGGPVITVDSEGDLHLSRVTLRGSGGETGDTPNPRGGCIHNSGRTSLDNVLVVHCFAAQSGGAIYNAGAARFSAISSIFDSNRAAAGSGGAIASGNEGSLTLQDTDFTGNTAQGSGGAVSTSGIADGITGGAECDIGAIEK